MSASLNSPHDSEVLIVAVERILRQITKLLIGRIAFPKLLSLIRKIFVEEAEKRLSSELGVKTISLTELGLVTGIDTRTISKIRESGDFRKSISQSSNFFTDLTPEVAVVDRWSTDPIYQDSQNGTPVELEIWGEGKTFEELVNSVIKSRGITVQSIVTRLLKSKQVEESERDGYLRLKRQSWMRYQDIDYEGAIKAGLMGVALHLNTVAHNISDLSQTDNKNFERLFWSTRISSKKISEFKAKLSQFLEEVSEKAIEEISPYDKNFNGEETQSAGVGFYYFNSDSDIPFE